MTHRRRDKLRPSRVSLIGVIVTLNRIITHKVKKLLGIPKKIQVVFNYLSYSVFFDNVVHILVAASGEVNKNGAVAHLLCKLHGVSNCV